MKMNLSIEGNNPERTSTESFLIAGVGVSNRWVSNIHTSPMSEHTVSLTPNRNRAMALGLEEVKILESMFDGLIDYYRVDTFDTNITSLIKRQL